MTFKLISWNSIGYGLLCNWRRRRGMKRILEYISRILWYVGHFSLSRICLSSQSKLSYYNESSKCRLTIRRIVHRFISIFEFRILHRTKIAFSFRSPLPGSSQRYKQARILQHIVSEFTPKFAVSVVHVLIRILSRLLHYSLICLASAG